MKSKTRRIHNQRGGVILWALIALAAVWIILILVGTSGYGYAGYYTHRVYSPSFWYFGSTTFRDYPSVRSGSVRGSSVQGGGPSAGK